MALETVFHAAGKTGGAVGIVCPSSTIGQPSKSCVQFLVWHWPAPDTEERERELGRKGLVMGALAGNEPEPLGRFKGQKQTALFSKARWVPKRCESRMCFPSHAASFGRSSFRPTSLPAQDGNPTRQHGSHPLQVESRQTLYPGSHTTPGELPALSGGRAVILWC